MPVDPRLAVGQLVAERFSRASVFDRFGIDYCCHGQTPLEQACLNSGAPLDEVLHALDADSAAIPPPGEPEYATMPLAELADHIEATHHVLMRRELPRLLSLLEKVTAAHADRHPELLEVATTYDAFREEIDSHLMKEERILFPMIRQLEAATSLPSFHCGSVRNPIRVMEHEHDSAGAALAHIRQLTGGFSAPDDGCASYRSLLDGLAAVEYDLHRHIHKENNILFPRAAALEASLAEH